MTSSQNPLQGLVLTPQQQSLLFAALNSNRPSDAAQPTNGFNMSPLQFDGSPIQADGMSSFQNSPDLDYEYDFAGADSSFDYYDDAGQPKMIGDLPGSKRSLTSDSGDAESPEKRSHPDDEEEEGPGAKRRESEEKMAKKPGRKPLTTEPTSVGLLYRHSTSTWQDSC
jgi:AP-1-like factor